MKLFLSILFLPLFCFGTTIEVTVRNANGAQTHGAVFDDATVADKWIATQTKAGAWGKGFTVTKLDITARVNDEVTRLAAIQEAKARLKTVNTSLILDPVMRDLVESMKE